MKIALKEFEIKKQLFEMKDINLEFESGKFHLIIGENGAGKTQLLNGISRINQNTSGELYFDGNLLNNRSEKKYLKKINFVSAHSRNLFDDLTGMENCLFFSKLYKLSKKESNQKIRSLADIFQLSHDLDKKVANYSNGMLQRLHFIRAFLNSPEILFLDEPVTGLDVYQSTLFYKYLKLEVKRRNMSIICIAHDLTNIEHYVNSVCLIKDSKVIWKKEIESLRSEYPSKCLYVDLESIYFEGFQKILNKTNIQWYEETPENSLYTRVVFKEKWNGSMDYIIKKGDKTTTLKDIFIFENQKR
ncbi:ATP-binding cassette domain-containing protein [Listeria seeligeri]|uniref:ATP-binding cassette domain-containing protein n=1 Tax=Listeria seeligeri TaxID=1640 RepID=UPI00162597BB|nr:ABC transporter ATP-binding protein [Listeria seeligeri]MBC1932221.1 ABC transporter ATP-binding protein [Listeria seeligeri]